MTIQEKYNFKVGEEAITTYGEKWYISNIRELIPNMAIVLEQSLLRPNTKKKGIGIEFSRNNKPFIEFICLEGQEDLVENGLTSCFHKIGNRVFGELVRENKK